MRPIVCALVVVTLAIAGCTKTELDSGRYFPQNDGANADAGGGLRLRNVFLLSGTDHATPSPQLALYGVLINDGGRPVQLERVTVDGGGTVQLAAPITVPPGRPAGTGSKPIGTVGGVKSGTVPMTFTFRDANPMRVRVPVMARAGQYATLPAAPAAPPAAPSPATPGPGASPPSSPGTSPTS